MYVALDEPDGVAGVAAIRNADPSLHEEIMEYESTGIWVIVAFLYSVCWHKYSLMVYFG